MFLKCKFRYSKIKSSKYFEDTRLENSLNLTGYLGKNHNAWRRAMELQGEYVNSSHKSRRPPALEVRL